MTSTDDVLIGYCHPDHVSALFHASLIRLLHEDWHGPNHILDVVSALSSPRIAATRNQLVETFLAWPDRVEWLLMLDADMVFAPDLLEQLLDAADPSIRPIVSGLYFGGRVGGKQVPHLYVWNDDGTMFKPIEGVGKIGEWGPVVRVAGAGAGCLLMHRSALIAIGDRFRDTGAPWFVEGAGGGKDIGEDLAFCARAHHLNIPIHAHTGVILGHHKYGVIDDSTYAAYLLERDIVGEDTVDSTNLLALKPEKKPVKKGAV